MYFFFVFKEIDENATEEKVYYISEECFKSYSDTLKVTCIKNNVGFD